MSQVPLTCGEHGSPAGPQQPAEPPHLPSRPAGVPATSWAEGAASAALLSLPSPLSQDSCVGSSLGPLGPPPLPQGRHRAECQPPLLLWCLPHVAGTPPTLLCQAPHPLSSNALCPQMPSRTPSVPRCPLCLGAGHQPRSPATVAPKAHPAPLIPLGCAFLKEGSVPTACSSAQLLAKKWLYIF